jgi:hypothetical protein
MTTAHNHQVIFGRKVAGCPRCAELLAGAKPVRGWGYQRKQEDLRRIAEIRSHNCRTAGCGPVCTFGDW